MKVIFNFVNLRRVGDSPLVGCGAYEDNEVGGASGSGDGVVLMRFLPAYVFFFLLLDNS